MELSKVVLNYYILNSLSIYKISYENEKDSCKGYSKYFELKFEGNL